ncbi:hypothetical protein Tco_1401864 [Tanacetum coccineum]
MYDGERLYSTKLNIDSPNFEETLEDAEQTRLKMKNKMIQLNYAKLNALYEIFVPQKEFSLKQSYFSTPSTSNVSSKSSKEISDLPTPKVPNESKLLKLFDKMDEAICALRKNIDVTLLKDERRIYFDDDSRVKRALFTSLIAARSRNLGATSVVTKSKFSVAKTPTATNKVIQLVLWIIDSGCSKHMTSNLQLLRNFVEKFMGTFRFGNDHFAEITGYGDYVQGNLTICYVYYVEGLRHNLFSVGRFCNELICLVILYSLEDSQSVSSKEDLDNLFGPLYEEYYVTRTPKVSNDSAANTLANTLDNEDTPSSSLIVVEEDEAPQIVSSLEEPVANEPANPVSNENANEPVQEDVTALDRNYFYNPFHTPVFEEAELSSTF